ncbi:hypothetical protein AB1N83_014477 [Pleurotus pulmonarius]
MSDGPGSLSQTISQDISNRAKAFEDLVLQCVDGKFPVTELVDKLEALGATPSEAADAVQQAQHALTALGPAGDRAATPEGLSEDALAEFRSSRLAAEEAARRESDERARKAVERLKWNLLKAKVASVVSLTSGSRDPSSTSQFDISALLSSLSSPTSSSDSSGLPSSVLAAAPHLAKLALAIADPHLDATWKLREAYSAEKAIDAVIDILQRQHMDEPIS